MVHSNPNPEEPAESGLSGPVLRAQLVIEPHPESSCAVVDTGSEATDLTHRLKSGQPDESAETGSRCVECHTELSFDPETGRDRLYLRSAVSNHCICPVFEQHDCIPQIKTVRSGAIVVVLSLARRDVLRDVISDLRATGSTVSVDWLVEGSDGSSTAEIDVSTVTDKQRDAMECAWELGYYETPRRADLSAVAEQLGISASATSQRLNAAERKLVTAFLDA
ncbi:helix-turn-helix domain-containing protein [Halovenus rubra]|uniref:Helix-turn-helix domain-containing protein n=2 Tax=Halovenus rubra TaxID=869890 RepID=A0ABD5X5C3_9EURY|nr:helix-turn-helix domain-containing protein [Halovenus rubra]